MQLQCLEFHIQEYVKPDDHTVSACVSNDLPGVMLPVGLHKASSSKEHIQPKLAGYAVHDHIGGGTFGDVYGEEWTRIQPSPRQHLAIKLLHKTRKIVKASAETQREIAILKDLCTHQHSRFDCVAGHSFKHAAHHASLRSGLEKVSETQWSER